MDPVEHEGTWSIRYRAQYVDATVESVSDRPKGDFGTRPPTITIAELEICHSRPIAPTRRIALGGRNLPCDPPPGAGGVLLAGVLAHAAPDIERELRVDLVRVMDTLAAGHRAVQPTVRHRFQTDRVGLTVSRQRLVSDGRSLAFDFDDENARAVQLALGTVYAAGTLPEPARGPVFEAFQSALIWSRPVDSSFISMIMGGVAIKADIGDLRAWNDPVGWALDVLELDGDETPSKRIVQRKFRSLLRAAHPDHGAIDDGAAARIAELSEARRILLAGQ